MTFRTMTGASPVDGSSRSSHFGRRHQRHAERQHLLLATGHGAGRAAARRSVQDRKYLVDGWRNRLSNIRPAICRFCSTDRLGNTLWPCGTKAMP